MVATVCPWSKPAPGIESLEFRYSIVGNARDTNPTQVESTWVDFVLRTSEPDVRLSKDGPALITAGFRKSGTRRDADVDRVHGIALDIDSGVARSEIEANLGNLTFAAWTTFSHTPDSQRWRIVVPFLTPVQPAGLNPVFEHFNHVFAGGLDAACRNPGHIHYLPAVPHEREPDFQQFAAAGAVFDPASVQTRRESTSRGPAVDLTALNLPDWLTDKIRTPDNPDRSADLHCVIRGLFEAGTDSVDIFEILTDQANGISAKPLGKGATWTRQEIDRQRQKHRAAAVPPVDCSRLVGASKEPQGDWRNKFILNEADMRGIKDPEFLIPNLVVRGHILILVGPPGSGKTTIMVHLAGMMARSGLSVSYINSDVGADIARYHRKSVDEGFAMLFPDFKVGMDASTVVGFLQADVDSGKGFDDQVLIFDTLKKFTDVLQKRELKKLFGLFRSITTRGGTVICLAHTNKYRDTEGNPIFEGVGDVRSDCDEMVYLIPAKEPDGSMLVSTQPDKTRGVFKPITFKISSPPELEVSIQDEFSDTLAMNIHKRVREEDDHIIRAINKLLAKGELNRNQIVDQLKPDHSWRQIHRILDRYSLPEK